MRGRSARSSPARYGPWTRPLRPLSPRCSPSSTCRWMISAGPASIPHSVGGGPSRRSRGCCCARARSSRCCWSSRTSTGSTRRPRLCSTPWSRAFPRRACSSWPAIARSTRTPGRGTLTTGSSGSTCWRPAPPTSCSTSLSAWTPASVPSGGCSSSAHRATPSSSRKPSGRWRRPECSWASVAPTAWPARSARSRFPRPRRRSSRRASTAWTRRTSGCSRRPPSSAGTFPCPYFRPSRTSRKRRCAPGSIACRGRSFCTNRRSSPTSNTLSSMP